MVLASLFGSIIINSRPDCLVGFVLGLAFVVSTSMASLADNIIIYWTYFIDLGNHSWSW